jgi:ribosomal protein S24E
MLSKFEVFFVKIKVLEEKHNPFLKRKELLVYIDHESEPTPSMKALEQFLIKDLSTTAEKLEILNIYSARGAANAKSQVHVWDDKKPEKKVKKKGIEKKEEPKQGKK